jgi:hypothetical protein
MWATYLPNIGLGCYKLILLNPKRPRQGHVMKRSCTTWRGITRWL